jgi:hypothetical protein
MRISTADLMAFFAKHDATELFGTTEPSEEDLSDFLGQMEAAEVEDMLVEEYGEGLGLGGAGSSRSQRSSDDEDSRGGGDHIESEGGSRGSSADEGGGGGGEEGEEEEEEARQEAEEAAISIQSRVRVRAAQRLLAQALEEEAAEEAAELELARAVEKREAAEEAAAAAAAAAAVAAAAEEAAVEEARQEAEEAAAAEAARQEVERASISIQSAYRGCTARALVTAMMQALAMKELSAVVEIQRHTRGHLARTAVAAHFLAEQDFAEHAAAIYIQCFVRMFMVRRSLLTNELAATFIQTHARRLIAQQTLVALRLEKEQMIRQAREQREQQHQSCAATEIQRLVRGRAGMRLARECSLSRLTSILLSLINAVTTS